MIYEQMQISVAHRRLEGFQSPVGRERADCARRYLRPGERAEGDWRLPGRPAGPGPHGQQDRQRKEAAAVCRVELEEGVRVQRSVAANRNSREGAAGADDRVSDLHAFGWERGLCVGSACTNGKSERSDARRPRQHSSIAPRWMRWIHRIKSGLEDHEGTLREERIATTPGAAIHGTHQRQGQDVNAHTMRARRAINGAFG